MANVDRPNGFKFVKNLMGTAPNAMIRFYEAADRSADATNNHGDLYIGDPVALSGTGVIAADSGDTVVGVVAAIGTPGSITHSGNGYFNADDLSKRFGDLANATGVIVGVLPAEGNLFEIQSAGTLTLAQGALADHDVTAATAHGSRTTGFSSAELVTSVNADVKVVEQVTTPTNDTASANARYIVKFQTTENTL